MSVSRPPHSTESALPIKEHAAATARLLRDRGWCQSAYHDEDGHLCVLGAALRAANAQLPGKSEYGCTLSIRPFVYALFDAIGAQVNGPTINHEDLVTEIVEWNDHIDTYLPDVLEVLDEMSK